MDMHALSFVGSCVLFAWLVLWMAQEISGNWSRIKSALKGESA